MVYIFGCDCFRSLGISEEGDILTILYIKAIVVSVCLGSS